MFLKYLDFIFAPFRAIQTKVFGIKSLKGNIVGDFNRSKNLMKRGQAMAGNANAQVNKLGGAQQQGAQAMQQAGQGMPGMPNAAGAPGGGPPGPGGPNPNPAIRTMGFWIFKKKYCSQCEQQLDKSWDACPFCAQMAQQAAVAPQKLQALKTQAFVIDSHGGPGSMQLLGWLVPLQGPQRGELFTLSPVTVIGTEPTCQICLNDKFMSSKHAEIKAEAGIWVLRDAGSTNGTYVNNKRVDKHELVDNDFIKFGSAMCKFKSL
ncbi:MAG: domain containing protein [Myxococcales bacterium]|nr:domain containing protein [Myxococcales bacterium]